MKDPQSESGKTAVPVPSSPRKVLEPDDLRYLIAPKEGTGEDSAIEKEVEPELGEDLEEDLEEGLDSMSIHAEDDDLLDSDNELGDLNELGKMFAAARFVLAWIHFIPEERVYTTKSKSLLLQFLET